jgi:hypothetical protein
MNGLQIRIGLFPAFKKDGDGNNRNISEKD